MNAYKFKYETQLKEIAIETISSSSKDEAIIKFMIQNPGCKILEFFECKIGSRKYYYAGKILEDGSFEFYDYGLRHSWEMDNLPNNVYFVEYSSHHLYWQQFLKFREANIDLIKIKPNHNSQPEPINKNRI